MKNVDIKELGIEMYYEIKEELTIMVATRVLEQIGGRENTNSGEFANTCVDIVEALANKMLFEVERARTKD